jgi:hypothetical protein
MFIRKVKGKRLLARASTRREDTIKINLRETASKDMTSAEPGRVQPWSFVNTVMKLGFVLLLSTTKMNIRNIPGGKGRPEREAENLTAICEPIV